MDKKTQEKAATGHRLPGRAEVPVGDINNVSVLGVNALGRLEADIMEAVWNLQAATKGEAVTVKEVLHWMIEHEKVYGYRGEEGIRELAYTTVLTTMSRLKNKGYLDEDSSTKTHLFSATMDKGEYEWMIAEKLIDAAFSVSPNASLSYIGKKMGRGGEGGGRIDKRRPRLLNSVQES